MSSGPVVNKDSTENQLIYDAQTEKGNSGSPVWFAQGSVAIAVAVHNNGPEDKTKGVRRGSRISPKLLRDVFTWANVDTSKRLRAENVSKRNLKVPVVLPPSGLFMVFGEIDSESIARLQRGSGTTFDVLPALVTAGSTPKHVLALGTKWVMFDSENQKAVLVDSPREKCLITIMEMKDPKKHPGVVTVNLADGFQLRMDGSAFRPHDLPHARTTGLSMIDLNKFKPVLFYHFMFESDPSVPYKPCTQLIATVQDDPQQDLSSMLCSDCRNKVFGAPDIKSP
jgi:hypothetical protein